MSIPIFMLIHQLLVKIRYCGGKHTDYTPRGVTESSSDLQYGNWGKLEISQMCFDAFTVTEM